MTQAGDFLGVSNQSYSVSSISSGYNEQNPQDWIDALKAALSELRRTNAEAVANLDAIGIAGHMHGATLLDKNGAILHPCILWNDTRSHQQASKLDQDKNLRNITGNIIFPGFTHQNYYGCKKINLNSLQILQRFCYQLRILDTT
ncbi:MAG: hypothetical protein CM15mP54_03480 [Paracoccaceae bacterium]|nr:MAG: hypothetical protein CM15mP54_03480 [Paracoccaceae bacterium]